MSGKRKRERERERVLAAQPERGPDEAEREALAAHRADRAFLLARRALMGADASWLLPIREPVYAFAFQEAQRFDAWVRHAAEQPSNVVGLTL